MLKFTLDEIEKIWILRCSIWSNMSRNGRLGAHLMFADACVRSGYANDLIPREYDEKHDDFSYVIKGRLLEPCLKNK